MLLREMTSSALAHSFKRFARCAVVGLALAGLAACGGGGGGSSTPAEKTPTTPDPAPTPTPDPTPTPMPPPEIPITPSGDTVAEAIDITGMETVEGELDSADDVDYYEIRVDEPTEVTLWVDSADVEFQVLDSEGNVLATSLQNSGGGSSSGLAAASAATPQAIPLSRCTLRGVVNLACLRIMLDNRNERSVDYYVVRVVAAHRTTPRETPVTPRETPVTPRRTKYTLRQVARTGVTAIRVSRDVSPDVALRDLEVGSAEDLNLAYFFTSEGETPLSYTARLVTSNLDPYDLDLRVTGSTLRLVPTSNSECRDRAAPKLVSIAVVASARIPPAEGLPEGVRETLATTSQVFYFGRNLVDEEGPRLVPDGPPLSLTVVEGSSATMTLTDHIEYPLNRSSLTFAVGSAPAGLDVTQDGPRLTVRAREDATDGSITVAATGRNKVSDRVCRTFLAEVSVEEDECPSDSGPRLRCPLNEISVMVGPDGNTIIYEDFEPDTISLTDYIEDPDGGRLNFSPVSPTAFGRAFGVAQDGVGDSRLTITIANFFWVHLDSEGESTTTVTATDQDGVSRNFPLRINYNYCAMIVESSLPYGSAVKDFHRDTCRRAECRPDNPAADPAAACRCCEAF